MRLFGQRPSVRNAKGVQKGTFANLQRKMPVVCSRNQARLEVGSERNSHSSSAATLALYAALRPSASLPSAAAFMASVAV